MIASRLRDGPPHVPSIRERIVRAAVFALALAPAVLVSACDNGDAKSDVARPRLEDGRIVFRQDSPQLGSFATEPVKESVPQQLRLSGRLVWDENRTVRLFPAFAGRVIHILVKAGDRVKPGQTLAMLASPDFGQAQADARRAQSDFALAEKNLNRLRELYAAGVSARKEMISAEADYARAEAELARATGKVKLYGGGSESVDQNLALASPIDGVVVERNINPGQELRPDLQLANSPPMFVITDPSRLWVQLDATESQLASLKRGQTVTLRSSAWPEESFEATVETISDFIDPTGEVPDAQRTLLQLPEKALVLSGGSYYVFVEESPGRFRWNEVKVEGVRDGVAGVVSGVDLGQKVVVEGTLLLHRLYRQLAGGAPA